MYEDLLGTKMKKRLKTQIYLGLHHNRTFNVWVRLILGFFPDPKMLKNGSWRISKVRVRLKDQQQEKERGLRYLKYT